MTGSTRRGWILGFALGASACASTGSSPPPDRAGPPRNVILLIGDGMGAGHIEAAHARGGVAPGADDRLALERLPVVGLVRTTAAGGAITDSAAAATAMATGVKTLVGSLGVAPDGTRLRSITETLGAAGVGIGFVSSGPITNATPAGFFTHVASREDKGSISRQLAASRADVLVGGSRGFDAAEEAARHGFTVLRGDEAFLATSARRVLALVDGLDGAAPAPGKLAAPSTLADLSRKALSLLASRGPCGFFLVVEEDAIDDWSHENDLPRMLVQLGRFDEAVAASVAFAKADGHTLVIVTADHETGGLLLVEDGSPEKPVPRWLTREHTRGSVALFAYGPRARDFAGVFDNTDLPKRLAPLFEERVRRPRGCAAD